MWNLAWKMFESGNGNACFDMRVFGDLGINKNNKESIKNEEKTLLY